MNYAIVNSNHKHPDVLVCGPGNAKVFSEVGAILAFEIAGLFDNITTIIGTSAGSVVAVIYGCGFKAEEMAKFAPEIDAFTDIMNHFKEEMEDLNDILQKDLMKSFEKKGQPGLFEGFAKVGQKAQSIADRRRGIFSMEPLKEKVKKLISKKINPNCNFKEFFKATKKDLIIVAYNMDEQKAVYYSAAETPNYSVVNAIMESCGLPYIFERQKNDKGHLMLDGGMCDPYPILVKDRGNHEILGLKIMSDRSTKTLSSDIGFVMSVSMMQLAENSIKLASNRVKNLFLYTKTEDFFAGYGFDENIKIKLMYEGFVQAIEFIKNTYHIELKNNIFPFKNMKIESLEENNLIEEK